MTRLTRPQRGLLLAGKENIMTKPTIGDYMCATDFIDTEFKDWFKAVKFPLRYTERERIAWGFNAGFFRGLTWARIEAERVSAKPKKAKKQ